MNKRTVSVDFSKKTGKAKPLHALPSGAKQGGAGLSRDISREFSEIGVPFVRLHDVEYPYGSNQFVDIHCIFPDFSKDADSPESYNFAPTDAYIKAIKEAGADVIFRLGESTDMFPVTLYTGLPSDIEKWADICVHILMHYNEGWADGFKYKLSYFEILGGADDVRVFSAERSAYFELYRVCSKKLKERFPKIKVGGYGSGGFYSLNRLNATDTEREYVSFLRDFLKYISAKETAAPLDFLSWYSYPASAEELALYAKYSRVILDEYGFKRTRSYVAGLNTAAFHSADITERADYVSDLASLLIAGGRSELDLAVISDLPTDRSFGKSFITSDGDMIDCPVYHTLLMYGSLYRLGTMYESLGDVRSETYTLASSDGKVGRVMICSRTFSGAIEVRISGRKAVGCKIRRIRAKDASTSRVSAVSADIPLTDKGVVFRADSRAVYLLDIDFSE